MQQFRGGGINELVRQAARMQRKVEQAKEAVKHQEVTASAAGDKVKATATAEGKITRLEVDKDFLAEEGLELALDALTAAANQALEQGAKIMEEAVSKATGGAKIPGLT